MWNSLDLEPGVLEALGGGGPGVGVELEHRREEVGELACLTRWPLVFLGEDLVEAPGLQARYVLQLASLVKEGARMPARQRDAPRYLTKKLDYVRQVIFVPETKVTRQLFQIFYNRINDWIKQYAKIWSYGICKLQKLRHKIKIK